MTAASNRIAVIALSGSDERNRVDFPLARAAADGVEAARRDSDVWAVVVHSARADFCAGTDPDALRAAMGIMEMERERRNPSAVDIPNSVKAIRG